MKQRQGLRARVARCRDQDCVLLYDWAMTCPEHPGDTIHCHKLADAVTQGSLHIARHRRLEAAR